MPWVSTSRKRKRPRRPREPFPVDADLSTLPKMSVTLVEFAKPLMDSEERPGFEVVSGSIKFAAMLWNLPVLETDLGAVAEEPRQAGEALIDEEGPELRL